MLTSAIDLPRQYLAGNLSLAILATIIVLARLYTCSFVLRSWKFEEYIIVAALVEDNRTSYDMVANVS